MTTSAPDSVAVPWYVVYAKAHHESVVELHLLRQDLDVFCPRLQLPDYAAGTRRLIPLFPGYLFVRLDLDRHFHVVSRTPGVKRLLGEGGVPTALDAEIVAFLKRNASPDGCLRARPDLTRGQEVEIADGPFAGLVAIIANPPDAQGRIRVLMRLLNRRLVTVRMSARFVKNAWVA